MRSNGIPTIDMSDEIERLVLVAAGIPDAYQGHPTTTTNVTSWQDRILRFRSCLRFRPFCHRYRSTKQSHVQVSRRAYS